MANLNISKNFTVDDIHKIRENDYEYTKKMSLEELVNYLNAPVMEVRQVLK